MIDTRIGADVAVTRFGNQHGISANEATRFLQDYFHQTRIFLLPLGDGLCRWRRHDRFKVDDRAFSLRNDFLSNDENVPVFKTHVRFAGGNCYLSGEIVPAANLRHAGESKQAYVRIYAGGFFCGGARLGTLGHDRGRGILRELRRRFTCEKRNARKKNGRSLFSKRPSRRCSTLGDD